MWEEEQSFLWFVNIFFFYMLKKPWLYMKDGLNLNNQKKRKTAAHIIHKNMLRVTAIRFYFTKSICLPLNKIPFLVLKIYVEQKLLHFLNYCPSPSGVWSGTSPWLPVSPPWKIKGFQMKCYISMCYHVFFSSLQHALSFSLTVSFHSSPTQIHALEQLSKGSLFICLHTVIWV